jgi:hypothetical protein
MTMRIFVIKGLGDCLTSLEYCVRSDNKRFVMLNGVIDSFSDISLSAFCFSFRLLYDLLPTSYKQGYCRHKSIKISSLPSVHSMFIFNDVIQPTNNHK